jgi:hypothetical protein
MRAVPDLAVPPAPAASPAVPLAPVPSFTPREPLERRVTVADGAYPYEAPVQDDVIASWRGAGKLPRAGEFPRRERKAPDETRPLRPLNPVMRAMLGRVRDGIRDLPDGHTDPIYAALHAERTGPQPVAGIAPEPEPEPGTWRPWLAGMAYAAARWADPPGPQVCAWCRESLAGLCEPCADAAEVAAAMDALHDRILSAATVTEALAMVGDSAAWQATTGIAGMRVITGRDGAVSISGD